MGLGLPADFLAAAMDNPAQDKVGSGRLLSLDVFRGLTMLLLVGEFSGFWASMAVLFPRGHPLHFLPMQFHHARWAGLHFWDLVQPFFMFIVGVAMPFSFARRRAAGAEPKDIFRHVLKRSFLLLLFGWALYCIAPGKIVFRFQNVLAQLSFTYFVAYLLMERKVSTQVLFSLGLLALTEILYRTFPVKGFDHPFTPNHNFGTWLDLQYGGADLAGHWVSFNAVPTAAHTIWGVLVGKLLLSHREGKRKAAILLGFGLAGLAAGYVLALWTPIIKRIATSSFVLVSGGWTLLAMAFLYWLVEIVRSRRWTLAFAVVGMNPLFIYLFAHVGGGPFLRKIVFPFAMALFGWLGKNASMTVVNGIVWFLFWYITYWLYKRKIFIRI